MLSFCARPRSGGVYRELKVFVGKGEACEPRTCSKSGRQTLTSAHSDDEAISPDSSMSRIPEPPRSMRRGANGRSPPSSHRPRCAQCASAHRAWTWIGSRFISVKKSGLPSNRANDDSVAPRSFDRL